MAEYYFRAPRWAHLPHIHTILDSIGNDRAVAKKLGLSEATIRRYRKTGQAPKPVMYALFWETPWGRETADINVINEARQYYTRAILLESQLKRIKKQMAALESELEGYQVAANSSFFEVGRR